MKWSILESTIIAMWNDFGVNSFVTLNRIKGFPLTQRQSKIYSQTSNNVYRAHQSYYNNDKKDKIKINNIITDEQNPTRLGETWLQAKSSPIATVREAARVFWILTTELYREKI